jgi:hypothetical protein
MYTPTYLLTMYIYTLHTYELNYKIPTNVYPYMYIPTCYLIHYLIVNDYLEVI